MQLRKVSVRLLVVAVALLFPLHAIAQDEDVIDDPFADYDAEELFDETVKEPDWIPSLRAEIGVSHHQGLGVLSTPRRTLDLNGDGDFVDPGEYAFAAGIENISGNRAILFGTDQIAVDGASFGAGIEIMGPAFEEVIGDMRIFVVGGIRDMLEGNTAVVRAQTQPPPFDIASAQVRTRGKFLIDKWYYGGMGAAFQLPIEGFNIKLKPSLNYMYIDGQFTSFLVQEVLNLPSGQNQDFPRQKEVGVINHAITPRIELDAEVYKQGPIAVGLFAMFETQLIVGGPTKHEATVLSCFDDGPAECANVDGSRGALVFEYDRDSIIYYGGIGIRMSWVGGP
ncbi:MAG: hypothetical protein VX246_04240 [Myxococcota bacterium]|nr:hypothetical protein [Myxococcota bacterium]